MSKEHKDLTQIYCGYKIRVAYNYLTKKYRAVISSVSRDVEYVLEKNIVELAKDANSAYKKARREIDNHAWQFILEKNECKLYVRLCFNDDLWEYKIENHEVVKEQTLTKEEAISIGTNVVEHYWQKRAVYFGIKIYTRTNQFDEYMCMVNNQILEKKFNDDLSAVMTGIKTADTILQT